MTKTDFILKRLYAYQIYLADDFTIWAQRKNEYGDVVQRIQIDPYIFYKLYKGGDIIDTKNGNSTGTSFEH